MYLCVYSGDSDGEHRSVPPNAALHERPREGLRLVPRTVPVRLLVRIRLDHVYTAGAVGRHVLLGITQAQEREGTQ